jgi:effector-binding domain-containing protein
VHQGDFRLFQDSYKVVLNWIERNGYTINGPYREVYHQFNRDNVDNVTVEIQFPVIKH